MQTSKNILRVTLSILALATFSMANPALTASTTELPVNLVQTNQERISGQLIDADESFFMFEDAFDNSVQLISRQDVAVLETNIGVNLFQVLKSEGTSKLIDAIELEDGTVIPCIILDISNDSIQYFTGESLKRHQVNSSDVYKIELASGTVNIPFPVLAAVPSI